MSTAQLQNPDDLGKKKAPGVSAPVVQSRPPDFQPEFVVSRLSHWLAATNKGSQVGPKGGA